MSVMGAEEGEREEPSLLLALAPACAGEWEERESAPFGWCAAGDEDCWMRLLIGGSSCAAASPEAPPRPTPTSAGSTPAPSRPSSVSEWPSSHAHGR